MDMLFEAASTSDVEERDLLESASSEYWDRVLLTANSHLNLRPPGASSELEVKDMEGTADSMVRVIHHNSSTTGGCVRLRCTIGPPLSREMPFLPFRILLCNLRRLRQLHTSLSEELKISQHPVGRVMDHQPRRLSRHPFTLPLLSPR